MKVSELIEQLKGYEDFELQFLIDETDDTALKYRTFCDIAVADIGHSEKSITLTARQEQQ